MAQKPKNDEGFSVLEAMIAIAILATGFLPLLALQTEFFASVEKLEQMDLRIQAYNDAVKIVRVENFDLTKTGSQISNDYELVWTAEPVIKDKYVRTQSGMPGRFTATLYDVNFQVNYNNGLDENIQIRGLGWTETRDFLDMFR